jgi:hypothetical protein
LRALAEQAEQLAASNEQRERAAAERWGRLQEQLQRDLGQLMGQLEQDLSGRAERAQELGRASSEAFAALRAQAEALGELLAEQRETVQRLVEQSGAQVREIGLGMQSAAGQALERLLKLGDEHGARFAELAALFEQGQTQHAQLLSQELTGHAERLGKGLESTGQLVHEASTLLHASGAELSAVATLFHQSVERQREAAQTWLESLGELEGTVERVGRGAAADVLGDQLASTQEVFARQLQFQRELFEQLRTLRGAVNGAGAKGERDASA